MTTPHEPFIRPHPDHELTIEESPGPPSSTGFSRYQGTCSCGKWSTEPYYYTETVSMLHNMHLITIELEKL